MAIPVDVAVWRRVFDPADLTNYVVSFDVELEPGEKIATLVVTPYAESVALGLTVLESEEHGPFIAGNTEKVDRFAEAYFQIDEEMRSDPAFSGQGAKLPVEYTITTDAEPPREYQVTSVLQVRQR